MEPFFWRATLEEAQAKDAVEKQKEVQSRYRKKITDEISRLKPKPLVRFSFPLKNIRKKLKRPYNRKRALSLLWLYWILEQEQAKALENEPSFFKGSPPSRLASEIKQPMPFGFRAFDAYKEARFLKIKVA